MKICRRLHIRARIIDHQPLAAHVKAKDVIDLLGENNFKNYYSFAIVRNPWDWQVSLYKFMLKNPNHHQHSIIKRMKNFDEYINWRCTEDVHFQKDFIYTDDGQLLVDFVGRFEQIDEDFTKICSRIGIFASLPKLNVSNTIPYQEFYNSETKALISKTFKPDISLFKYNF